MSDSAYPVARKTTTGQVHNISTTVTSMQFTDRIMITISQDDMLAQWISVPLESANPAFSDQLMNEHDQGDGLLPLAHLTPKTLLGGSGTERETIGQLYATQIASAILTRNPEERRPALIGLGLSKIDTNREAFYDLLDLVMTIL